MAQTIRVAAAQTANRTIPFRAGGPDVALARVAAALDELVCLAERAAEQGCRIVAFPEDTLGTLEWEAGHWDEIAALLRPAEALMLARFGAVARERGLAIVCCNDLVEGDAVYNTAVLIGTDGEEIGRYRKVQPTWSERARALGDDFPVFEVPGVGPVGLCICYDMLFPETTRALALGGADIVFHCTLGGASMGDGDASLAAFRTRAAENFLYLVVAFRSGGSMVIGPKGQILAQADGGGDRIVAADIDPAGGRDAGDALGGITADFRARLFRERNPAAYRILVDAAPPVLGRLRDVPLPTADQASARMAEGLTTGAEAFYAAERLQETGDTTAARACFETLAARFGTLWIGRAARDRLTQMDDGTGG